MPGRDPTQKQTAAKYKGNLTYFNKGHYLRRWRAIIFLLAVIISIGGALTFRYWGKEEYLSTGPISENHARFAHDCQVCHEGAQTDLLAVLPFHKASNLITDARGLSIDKVSAAANDITLPSLDSLTASGGAMSENIAKGVQDTLNSDNLLALAKTGISYSSLSLMDKACLKCHQPMGLHQPQSGPIALRGVLNDIPLVHATSCTSCHREHVGHERMKLPGSETCASCHNDATQLAATRKSFQAGNPRPVPAGLAENRNIGDGLIRFITSPKPIHAKPFKTYAEGHPPFDYEAPGLRDPAKIKYNHSRHEQGDIPALNGHKLNCVDCHKPGGNGVYYQKVKYEEHCSVCHSLHINPDMPEIKIPHGDTEKVRDYVRPNSLRFHYAAAFLARGISDNLEVLKKVKEQLDNMESRGMTTSEEIERRVFFVGDPPADKEGRNTSKSNMTPFFPACAKCHEMEPAGAGAPKVRPTNMAERWVNRGPFTHVPHAHMDCLSCHGAAKTSKLTSDILMPTQKLCAECHRPLDKAKFELSQDTLKLRSELRPGSHEMADAQRRTGGVKYDCQSCHIFHAPPAATILIHQQQAKK
ncbi:MAG: hypothetical protein JWL90_195 [Chthoniobacteraceae bacterium]|nr:hypothetical protein [Chthoniobacteraceae bacterium]